MIRKTTALIAGVGAALGAGVMYLLDPDKGRRRRAMMGDKLNKARHSTQEAVTRTARDAANRTRGLVHEQKKRHSKEEVPDDVLVSRVRSEMGHVVERPADVTVTALGGRVTLSGNVRDDEVETLTKHVSKLPGVAGVDNRLNAPQADRPGVN